MVDDQRVVKTPSSSKITPIFHASERGVMSLADPRLTRAVRRPSGPAIGVLRPSLGAA
jgi:hypothetical protein